jgi:hypothetical protein
VELPPPSTQGLQFGINNVGIVHTKVGEMSGEELASEFSIIYKTTWPCQIRTLDEWKFLMKFPPYMAVVDVASYPCFGLGKEGVTVNVEVWDGELEFVEETHDVWLQLRGINPKWCKWGPLAQFASVLGIMIDVYFCGAFKFLCEVVRIKIQCKDPILIPSEWFFEMEKKFYKIGRVTELPKGNGGKGDDPQDPSDPDAENNQGSEKIDMETEQGGL